MSDSPANINVRLKRAETSTPWGFRMQGGADYGTCSFIQKVTARSLAEKAGLRAGDGIVLIGGKATSPLDHNGVKMEIIRSGNDLDLVIQRNAVDIATVEGIPDDQAGVESPSSFTGYTDPKVQSRSFKILQASLNYSEPYVSFLPRRIVFFSHGQLSEPSDHQSVHQNMEQYTLTT